MPPPGTLFYRQFTNILEPLVPLLPIVACKLLIYPFSNVFSPFELLGVVSPTFPWCVGPLSGPTRNSSLPPQSPLDEVPNDLNILESVQENTSKRHCTKIKPLILYLSVCKTVGLCEPLIEDYLEVYRDPSIEEINLRRIEEINNRTSQASWRAGRTSLFSESFSEVLAYRMGELPATDVERSGDRTAAREFLREMEDNAGSKIIGKLRKKRDVSDFFSAIANTGGYWSKDRSDSFRGILNSLKEALAPSRPSEFEVFSTDATNQGVCSACAAFAVTSAFETCVHKRGYNPGNPGRGLSQQNLLDCGFNSFGLAGCDGGKSFRYMQWLMGGDLENARYWPYLDGSKKWEIPENSSLSEGYARRPGTGRCLHNQEESSVVLNNMVASWDEHNETDIENILMDGHAVVTTMEVTLPVLHKWSVHVRSVPKLASWSQQGLPVERTPTRCGDSWIRPGPGHRP